MASLASRREKELFSSSSPWWGGQLGIVIEESRRYVLDMGWYGDLHGISTYINWIWLHWCDRIVSLFQQFPFGWWLNPTPVKNMISSVGMMTFSILWRNKIHVPNHQPDISWLPSGKLTVCYGKWQFFIGKSTINGPSWHTFSCSEWGHWTNQRPETWGWCHA